MVAIRFLLTIFGIILFCQSVSSLSTTTCGSSYTRYSSWLTTLTTTVGTAGGFNVRAVHSSGGAAGGVVTEGQGYGQLICGLTLTALGPTNANYAAVLQNCVELYQGWKKMCTLSTGSASCQSTPYCGGGKYPCLPHWKFDDLLTAAQETGPAPDGDIDAATGLILMVRATAGSRASYTWWNEIAEWAYQTCKQFMDNECVTNSAGQTVVKLGTCWGGFDCSNPSYSAPGQWRYLRNYMSDYSSFLGHGTEGSNYVSKWNVLINTTYKMLIANQCPSGITPNWLAPNADVTKTGATTCSGSGTPAAQWGAEAGRGSYRVALDYIWFPSEFNADATTYISRFASSLISIYSAGSGFGNPATCGITTDIFPTWTGSGNAFMFGPACSTLRYSTGATNQQSVLDYCGNLLSRDAISTYYSASWICLSTLCLNGDADKAISYFGAPPTASSAPSTTKAPAAPPPAPATKTPTAPPPAPATKTPTAAPLPAPTKTPTSTTSSYTCTPGNSNPYWLECVSNAPTTATVVIKCAGVNTPLTYSTPNSKWSASASTACPAGSSSWAFINNQCCPISGASCNGVSMSVDDSAAADPSAQLSTGAIVGIIVGVCVIGVIAIIIAIVIKKKSSNPESV